MELFFWKKMAIFAIKCCFSFWRSPWNLLLVGNVPTAKEAKKWESILTKKWCFTLNAPSVGVLDESIYVERVTVATGKVISSLLWGSNLERLLVLTAKAQAKTISSWTLCLELRVSPKTPPVSPLCIEGIFLTLQPLWCMKKNSIFVLPRGGELPKNKNIESSSLSLIALTQSW